MAARGGCRDDPGAGLGARPARPRRRACAGRAWPRANSCRAPACLARHRRTPFRRVPGARCRTRTWSASDAPRDQACRGDRPGTSARIGSSAFAGSSAKYMRVASRVSRPRASTRDQRGAAPASGRPGPGTRPGRTVSNGEAPVGRRSPPGRSRRIRRRAASGRSSAGWRYRPAAFACHTSMMASGTGSPAPSRSEPCTTICRPSAAARGDDVAAGDLEAEIEEGADRLRRA